MRFRVKIVTSFLVSILLVSFYVGVIPSIELFCSCALIRSFELFDYGDSASTVNFEMSDLVLFRADVNWGNAYCLEIFNETCEVVSRRGCFSGSSVEVFMPLYPPEFRAKNVYGFRFNVYAANFPILGAMLSDSKMGVFSVDGTKTNLQLNVSYAQEIHELSMHSLLLNGEYEPVANQSVSYFLQPKGNDTSLPYRGWIYLGNTQTGEDGCASFSVARNIEGGIHRVQARFNGFEDVANSVEDAYFTIDKSVPNVYINNVSKVLSTAGLTLQIVDDEGFPLSDKLVTLELLNSAQPSADIISDWCGFVSASFEDVGELDVVDLRVKVWEDAFTYGFEDVMRVDLAKDWNSENSRVAHVFPSVCSAFPCSESIETIYVSANESQFYALMPIRIYGCFSVNRSLGALNFSFYLDGTEYLGSDIVTPIYVTPAPPDPPFWAYASCLVWEPDENRYLGEHNIVVYAKNSSDVLVAEGSLSIEVLLSPMNLRLSYPSTFLGSLRLTSAFSSPRIFEPVENGFVRSYRLAPQFSYDLEGQCVDEVYIKKPVHLELYVNGSFEKSVNMVGNGLWTYHLPLGFVECSVLNVTVKCREGIYYGDVVKEIVPLTRVNVSEAFVGDDNFTLAYNVGPLDFNDRTYGFNVSASVDAELFNSPLRNATVTFIAADRTYRLATSATNVWDADYLGLVWDSFYNISSPYGNSLADVNHDGEVDILDVVAVTNHYGKTVLDLDWKNASKADLNGDLNVGISDIIIVTSQYGKNVSYVNISDPMVVAVEFVSASNASLGVWNLDSKGFVRVHPDAVSFRLLYEGKSIGAIVEGFQIVSECDVLTDFAGEAECDFVLPSEGAYVVQARLPSSFDAVVVGSAAASVDACLNEFYLVYAVRRPVRLWLDYELKNVTGGQQLSMVAYAIDETTGDPVEGRTIKFCGDKPWNGKCVDTNSSGIAVYTVTADYKKYDVFAYFDGDDVYLKAESEMVSVDLRANVSIHVKWYSLGYWQDIEDHGCIDVTANIAYEFRVTHISAGCYFHVYVNEELLLGPISGNFCDAFSFNWAANASDLYYFKITCSGSDTDDLSDNFKPREFWFVANASVRPIRVYFDVSPNKFMPGETVSLEALAVWADSNVTVTELLHFKFLEDGEEQIGHVVDTYDGTASVDWVYPSSGAHTVTVHVWSAGPLVYMVEPVSLEVYRETVLRFWVDRDNSSEHTFSGQLLTKQQYGPSRNRIPLRWLDADNPL